MPTSLLSTGVQFPDNSVQGVSSNYILRAYTSPATWTKPTGLKAVEVTVVGGGGAGRPTEAFGASGGGGGGTSILYLPAPSVPGPISVTVGAGGSGPTATAGGTSSFGPLASATGGAASVAAPAPPPSPGIGPGGAGGAGSGGTVNIPGGQGHPNILISVGIGSPAFIPGNGGDSLLGYGGKYQPNLQVDGTNGLLYGGGGSSGRGRTPTQPPFPGTVAGGNGAAGIVIVEEFYG
jgi:hypothetical protein